MSERRWEYSGGTDLVLVGAWLMPDEEPTVDWISTISGQTTEGSVRTLTLAEVVERMSRDLEQEIEDPHYGVGDVVSTRGAEGGGIAGATTREFLIDALAGIVANVAAKNVGG